MKRRSGIPAIAAAVLLLLAVPGQAADIGDFLTGGSGTPAQTADPTTTDNDVTDDLAGTVSNGEVLSQSLNVVTCTDSQTGINVARAMVPAGYSVDSQTIWCGACQSPDYPAEVFISTQSPDGGIMMTYESGLSFIQVLDAIVNGMQFALHQDGVINPDYLTMQLAYMNASQYCDYVSQNLMEGASGMTFVSEKPLTQEELDFLQQISQKAKENSDALLIPGNGMSTEYVETTYAQRTYRYTDSSGKAKLLVVSTGVQGITLKQAIFTPGAGEMTMRHLLWSIPARFCLMVDEDRYEEGMSVFESFAGNTTLSDQFKQAMKELSQQIVTTASNARAASLSEQSGYVQDTFSSTLSGQDDTYSAIDAWDDVIMERNDYTLSSGDSVKVDTSYDYVYELSDGNIYATNSALDEPADGTRLYAN